MLPGKKYGVEDIAAIAWRRKWLIVVPFVITAVAVAVYSHFLPNRYRSESVILVVPQRVPKEFVRSTVTAEVDERLQSISQQILSRTRLERIILDFNLYPEERRTGLMEDVVDNMRQRDVSVQISRPRRNEDSTSFRVGFAYGNARTAMQVTERIASLFIEENLRDREVLAEGTDQFLESQLEEARRQLLENEERLQAYKRQYMGQLPTQLQSNLTVLQNTQTQLQSITEAISRDRDQRSLLQRMLNDALTAPAAPSVGSTGESGGPVVTTAAAQAEAARSALASMQTRLKPEHPDLIRAKRLVAELERKAAEEALTQPLAPADASSSRPSDPKRQSRVDELRSQMASLDVQIGSRQREEQRLRAMLQQYQGRVEAAPARESELVALTRDYDTLRDRYTSLLSKREDARISANLERRQIGEQFKIIDSARLPERPESPDRTRINLMGAAAGLALGLALAGFLEYRSTVFLTDADIVATLALPVIALVPVMETKRERAQRRKRRMLVSWATAGAVVFLGVIAAMAWKFGFLKLGV